MGSLRIDPDYVADGCNVRGDLPMTFAFGRMAVIDDTTGAVEKECPGAYGVEIANAKGTRAMRCYMNLAALQEAAVSMLSFCRDEEVRRLLGTSEDGGGSGAQTASEDPRPLPEAEEPTQTPGPRYIAHFNPEAWVNDYAVSVDPEGPQEWDCTDFILAQHREFREEVWEGTEGSNYWTDDCDTLMGDPAAPTWVRDWSGPFTITVRRQDG